jgi:hypothetical protein
VPSHGRRDINLADVRASQTSRSGKDLAGHRYLRQGGLTPAPPVTGAVPKRPEVLDHLH